MDQQSSDATRRRGRNSRCGQAQFSDNSRTRVQLGALPSAAIPGVPLAAGNKGCILCCEKCPSYVSVGACGHADVCWVCAVRLRALSCDRHCPVCKMDLEVVVLTNDASTVSLEHSDLKQMVSNEQLGMYFADTKIEQEVAALFDYQCTMENCSNQNGCRFSKLQQLEDHLWYVHWRQLCQTCILERPAFLCEQYAYCSRDMHRHCREGDCSHNGMPALPAHPTCKFCKQYFYSEEELHQHMHMAHHLCHICEKMGRRNEFYGSWHSLSLHYQQHHYVCAHADCVQNGFRFIAFANEDELHLHHLAEHHRGQGSTDRRMRLNVGHVSYTESNSHGNGVHHRTAFPDGIGCEIQFMWPAGATATELEPDSLPDTKDRIRRRYPNRTDDRVVDRIRRRMSQDRVVLDADPVQTLQQIDVAAEASVLEHDMQKMLDVRVESLELVCTVASSGPRCGARCATDAICAVLNALTIAKTNNTSRAEVRWQTSLRGLSGGEAEGLDHMRVHLEELGDLGSSCNWEPLERVLALRPLFVRLLCHSQNSGRQREVIGPKGIARQGDAEQWLKWKRAAQSAVLALGELERHSVAAYLKLCMERRDGASWLEAEKASDAMFPALLGSEDQNSESSRWRSDRCIPPPVQLQEEQFPVLGNPVNSAGHAQSAWTKPLPERRSNRPRFQAPVVASTERLSKKTSAENRAAETLARIAAAKDDYKSRRVDHWEELA